MTSDKKFDGGDDMKPQSGSDGQAHEPPREQPSGARGEQGGAGAGVQQGEDVGQLKAEIADLKDRVLRAHAEMDNVRKRLEREKSDQAKFAITKFARDILGIGDNVQRAIEAVPQRMLEQDEALKSFFEGVTMIERELLSVLGRHGIKRLDPKGEAFDPNFHQAVVEMPSEDVPAGAVTQVFQAGYMIEDRVLRPAMVAVSKGGAKPQAPAHAANPGGSSSIDGQAGASSGGGGEPGAPRDKPAGPGSQV